MAPTPANLKPLLGQVAKLSIELDLRTREYLRLERYYEGMSPFPAAVQESKLTRAYRRLMPVADAPWGSLVVGSVIDRLEVAGIRDENQAAADAVWELWQRNCMDAEAPLAHESGLISGRAFALVWPGSDGATPEISLDNSSQMAVQYAEGSRRKRVAALRRWKDADSGQMMATLYRPEGIYKFQESGSTSPQDSPWAQRETPGEDWPVVNPWNVVPVVEIPFNPRLKPGEFGYARGEYAHCLGLIDRINLLTFLGLVVAFWTGFPVRAIIGDRILRDDDGQAIPPIELAADQVAQFENPQTKLDSWAASDRSNLSVFAELSQLAAITKTPRHYFPIAQAFSNLSADALRADEGALSAKVTKHKGSAGGGWGETHQLLGLMSENELSPSAQVIWKDQESRSLAERADAASKLQGILPWQALVERVLNASQDDIARWEAMKASDTLSTLIAAANKPPPEASANGSGVAANVSPDVTPMPVAG